MLERENYRTLYLGTSDDGKRDRVDIVDIDESDGQRHDDPNVAPIDVFQIGIINFSKDDNTTQGITPNAIRNNFVLGINSTNLTFQLVGLGNSVDNLSSFF